MEDEEKINKILDEWNASTMHLSVHDIDNPLLGEIYSMDKEKVIPVVLQRVRENPSWDFVVLFKILPEKDHPIIPENSRGRFGDMLNICIQWGIEKGYLK